MENKVCYSCKETKHVSEFYRSNKIYYQKECKECNRKRKHKWHQTEQGKRSSANTKLKNRFGITIDEYDKLVDYVDGKCQICGAICSINNHRLCIDHSHETGKIRGILCKSCNSGLGNFRDDPILLINAVKYIQTR